MNEFDQNSNFEPEDMPLVRRLREQVMVKLGELDDLPTLPAVVMKVLELAYKENVSIRSLKQVIVTDPPLTAKVLRVANSVYYGRATQTSSIDQAIVTIGLDMLVTICTSMGVINSFNAWEERKLERNDIWRHALSTGFLAKSLELRKAMGQSAGPDIFLCGLLHNIGWIIIDQYFEDELDAVLKTASETGEWHLWDEREILGMDHAELGALFLEKWGLPPEVASVVRNHHDPDRAGEFAPQAALVGLSATISPIEFALEVKMDHISEHIPHQLKHTEGVHFLHEMRQRYANHITSAKAMTDQLMDWM